MSSAAYIAVAGMPALPRRLRDGIGENPEANVAAAAVDPTVATIAVVAAAPALVRRGPMPRIRPESGAYEWTSR